jgi:D-alanine-D-alanine ligase
MAHKDKRVGVLLGGLSSEREVSLETGAGVLAALKELGYDAVGIDWKPGSSLPALLAESRVDVVWNALHGTYGEDGAVQGLLSCLGIPCTGSGILASSVAMDKVFSKRVFDSTGIPTPKWQLLEESDGANDVTIDLPCVVKPAREGSSVGVSIVRELSQLKFAIAEARQCEGPPIVEEYIDGAEVDVGVLGSEIIGSVELRPATEFYDYEAKYKRDDTQYLLPPEIAEATLNSAEAIALRAHNALGCTGYSRVDLMIKGDAIYVIEVNTLPGMTSHSLLPKIAAAADISYAALCEKILLATLEETS